jgi:hypothetical protein
VRLDAANTLMEDAAFEYGAHKRLNMSAKPNIFFISGVYKAILFTTYD